MKFNSEYVRSIMPNGPTKEEQRINKQWKRIQKRITQSAKHGYSTYECWYKSYDQEIWSLLSSNGFKIHKDWQNDCVEIEW